MTAADSRPRKRREDHPDAPELERLRSRLRRMLWLRDEAQRCAAPLVEKINRLKALAYDETRL